MTTFNTERKEVKRWFPFEDGGNICLRLPTMEEMEEIEKECTTIEIEYPEVKQGEFKRFEVKRVDEKKRSKLFWRLVIVEWKDLFSDKEKKKPIEFNDKNIFLLVNRSIKFVKKVNEFLEVLRVEELERAEEVPKN